VSSADVDARDRCDVALTYRSAVNDPARFTHPKKVGPWAGLTPSRNQSGERDVVGGITKAGDIRPQPS
jgi:transposase